MMTPDKTILKELKSYDSTLFIKWNNRDGYFEIWRHCLGGEKLITPVCPNLYHYGAPSFTYTPLDRRIIAWLYNADSWRVGKKEWIGRLDKRFKFIEEKRKKEKSDLYKYLAKENYVYMKDLPRTHRASLNSDKFRHKKNVISDPIVSKFIKPDLHSPYRRVMQRSPQNLNYYFSQMKSKEMRSLGMPNVRYDKMKEFKR